MKLYYATGTCSMSCVMAVKELNIPCELVEVSWKRNQNVAELDRLNPLKATPVLVAEGGQVLGQNAAILEYLADRFAPGKYLAAAGTWDRVQTMSWLSFVASDFHKAFVPAFRAESMTEDKKAQSEIEEFAKGHIVELVEYIDQSLRKTDYISGAHVTIADFYLFTILQWCEWIEVSLAGFPKTVAYMKRMADRPGIKQALELEKN